MTREDVIQEMVKTWLISPIQWCGWCGKEYDPTQVTPCCSKPYIATNREIMQQFLKQLNEDRDTRTNIYASTKGMNMRWTLSFPLGLMEWLSRRFKERFHEELFNKKYNQKWFAKKFYKWFCVPTLI